MDTPSILWNDTLIPNDVMENWQEIINIIAKIMNVPSALIMRVHPPSIEVFLTSNSDKNPYEEGEMADLPGLYCNTVMQSRQQLLIPDAREDPEWDHNPDIKLGMVSYLGFPLEWPNGDIFGTICVLDSQKNHYSQNFIDLLSQFRKMAQNNLRIITQQSKIQNLKKVIPMCAYCEKIRTDDDRWISLKDFLHLNEKNITHGVCSECSARILKEL